MVDKNHKVQEAPNWWQDSGKDYHDKWNEGISLYFDNSDAVPISLAKPGVDLTKKMIPFIADKDPRWKKFDAKLFNTGEYTAHAELTCHIRNRVTKLKAEYEKKLKDTRLEKER